MRPSVAGALCGQHPAVAAVEICTRCGRFMCAECVMYRRDEQPYCSDCLTHLSNAGPSRRANVGLGFAIGGISGLLLTPVIPMLNVVLLPLALVTGLVGLVVSWRELRAIARGDAPAAGRSRARAGRIIGLVHAVLGVLFVGLIAFAISRS